MPKPSWFREFLRTWGPALLAVLLIRTYIFEPFRIPSGSMVPTLLIGDHVLVTKSSYGAMVPATGVEIPFLDQFWIYPRYELLDWGNPDRGDVIVFRYPMNQQQNYIKRVIGIPGDRLRVRGGKVIVDGEIQDQKFSGHYGFIDKECREHRTKHFVEDLGNMQHETLSSIHRGSLRNMDEVTVPPGHVFVMGDNRDNSLDSRVWGFVRYDQIKGKAHFVWLSWDGCEGRLRSERVFHSLYSDSGGIGTASAGTPKP